MLPVLYVGSCCALRFATGAGWISIEQSVRLQTIHRPIYDYVNHKDWPGRLVLRWLLSESLDAGGNNMYSELP